MASEEGAKPRIQASIFKDPADGLYYAKVGLPVDEHLSGAHRQFVTVGPCQTQEEIVKKVQSQFPNDEIDFQMPAQGD